MNISDGDRKVVAKVLKAKSPAGALEKAAEEKKKKAPDLVWGWLAAGVVPFEGDIVNLAYDLAGAAKPELVIEAAGRWETSTLRTAKAMYSCAKSYRAYAKVWDDAELSPLVEDFLAYGRVEAGRKLGAADGDRLLDFYAEAAVDTKHTFGQRLTLFVVDQLGLDKQAFSARVVKRLTNASGMNFDTCAAMEAAPWSEVEKLLRATPANDIADGFFMASVFRAHPEVPAADLFALCGGEPMRADVTLAILDRALAQNEDVPAAMEEPLAQMLADTSSDMEHANKVARLPKKRIAGIAAKLAELDTECSEAAWGFVPNKKRDNELVARIVQPVLAALESNEWDEPYESLSDALFEIRRAGFHGVALIERAVTELSKDKRFATRHVGALTRLLFKRVTFSAMKGGPRDLALLLPGDDLESIDGAQHVIGDNDLAEELTPSELTAFRAAWRPYNWDGQLSFDDDGDAPEIDERAWSELAPLVARTSFARLCNGQEESETLTKLFAHDVSLVKKLELAEAIANRVMAFTRVDPTDMRGLRAIVAIFDVLVPMVHDADRALDGDLAACALHILRNDAPQETVELLAKLPRKQVEAWIEALCAEKSAKVKKRGKALAALLH